MRGVSSKRPSPGSAALVLTIVVSTVAAVLAALAPSASAVGYFDLLGKHTKYTDPAIVSPSSIVTGPDGNLWFTDSSGVAGEQGWVGRMTTAGVVTKFTDGRIGVAGSITVGPDGNLWFIDGDAIDRITTSGVITRFTDPALQQPQGITSGPGGNLWFTEYYTVPAQEGPVTISAVGRMTTAGVVTVFQDPGIHLPVGIAAGPDGNLWFIDIGGSRPSEIGRMTPAGAVTTFPDHAAPDRPAGAGSIAVGADGNLWFPGTGNDTIGRITTSGALTVFHDASLRQPGEIAAGPDGDLWFTIHANGNIGRITTAGVVSGFGYPGSHPDNQGPQMIVPGPDGNMWLADFTGHTIWKIGAFDGPSVLPGNGVHAEGDSGTTNFSVGVSLSKPSTQTVTVQWNTAFISGASDIQATPGVDYTAASGTATFAPGQTSTTVTIPVHGDAVVEPDEWIVVSFHGPTNARIGGYYGLGFGVIQNDD